MHRYKDVTLTFGGIPFPATRIDLEVVPRSMPKVKVEGSTSRGHYEASIDIFIPSYGFSALDELMNRLAEHHADTMWRQMQNRERKRLKKKQRQEKREFARVTQCVRYPRRNRQWRRFYVGMLPTAEEQVLVGEACEQSEWRAALDTRTRIAVSGTASEETLMRRATYGFCSRKGRRAWRRLQRRGLFARTS